MENNNIEKNIKKNNGKMVHMKNKSAIFKKIVFIAVLIYAIVTFIKQQKILNSYATQTENLETQIAEATEYQQKLNEEKENVNSSEYIEAIARDKLDMYLPNERVYVDNEN